MQVRLCASFRYCDLGDKSHVLGKYRVLHTIGRPAIIWSDGYLQWCFNNKSHRINGFVTKLHDLKIYSLYHKYLQINISKLVI